jgi:hypothetical protein
VAELEHTIEVENGDEEDLRDDELIAPMNMYIRGHHSDTLFPGDFDEVIQDDDYEEAFYDEYDDERLGPIDEVLENFAELEPQISVYEGDDESLHDDI